MPRKGDGEGERKFGADRLFTRRPDTPLFNPVSATCQQGKEVARLEDSECKHVGTVAAFVKA